MDGGSGRAGGGGGVGATLVTGASTGIGRAIALALAKAGHRSFGTVRRADDARALEAEGVEALIADVADEESLRKARSELDERLEGAPLSALVNNAGVGRVAPLEHLSSAELRALYEVNVFGAHAATRAFLGPLIASRGVIVNVSSVSARVTLPFLGAYASSKAALESLSDALRRELAPRGVRVVVVQPGPVRTPIWSKMREAAEGGRFDEAYRERLERFGRMSARAEERGLPVGELGRVVARLVVNPRPPARVLVTPDSSLTFRLMGLLPDTLVDRLIAKRLRPR